MLTCISCTLFMWGWGWVGGENFNWRPKAFMLSDLWQFFSLWLCFLTSDLYDVSLLGWTFLSVIWVFLMVESFCLQSGKAEAEKVQADFSNLSRKEELEVCVNFHFLSHWWISDVQNPSTSCYPTEYMAVWMYVSLCLSLCLCLSLSLSACLHGHEWVLKIQVIGPYFRGEYSLGWWGVGERGMWTRLIMLC